MKNWIILLLIAQSLMAFGQANISDSEWRDDLRVLQKKINEEYDHLFYRTTREAFNREVEDLYEKIPDLEAHEIIVGFASIIADFKIGHTVIQLVHNRHGSILNTGFTLMPVNFYLFDDGLYVEGAHESYAELVGAKVKKIGNMEVDAALKALRSVVSMESESYYKAYGIPLLSCPQVLNALGITTKLNRVLITGLKDGNHVEVTIDASKNFDPPIAYGFTQEQDGWMSARAGRDVPLYLKDLHKPYSYEYLEDSKMMYVRFSQVRDDHREAIPVFFKRVFDFIEQNEVEKIVLDARLNQGGDGYKNKPIVLGLIKSPLNKEGKLFTIIGRNTFSAAQNLVNQLEKYTSTTFVGETTSQNVNSYGDTEEIILPNSQLEVRLSVLWWQEMDPRDKRLGTEPDVPIALTFSDYKNNIDPVMEAISTFDESPFGKIKLVKRLFFEGDYAQAKERVVSLSNLVSNHEFNLTSKINTIGYDLISEGQLNGAAEVFKLNVELYPNCANCWDSLGEINLMRGNIHQALAYYQKALEMDPHGRTGANAKRMIDRINFHRSN